MYLSHWELSRSPFHTAAGLGPAYPGDAFNEATARIEYLVSERRRMGVLLGDAGLGKSTVLGALAESFPRRGVRAVAIEAVALTPQELLWRVACGLGAGPDLTDATPRLWRRIEDALAHGRWQGTPTVLLVDDADQAGPDTQRQLVRLAGLESAPGARWTMILAAPPRRLDQLSEPLLHRVDMRIDLHPWSADDAIGYVQHALVDAGRLSPVFTEEALQRLHERSAGVPRHVARLADFALVAGAGAGLDLIGPGVVDAAFDELRWSPPAAAVLVD